MVSPPQGKVCGLCGNYDGNSKNDFTTRSQETVASPAEFGNSWKVSSSCPDAKVVTDTCSSNPYRAAWSQKQCSIINSITFKSCHSQVTMATAHTHVRTPDVHSFAYAHSLRLNRLCHLGNIFMEFHYSTQQYIIVCSRWTPIRTMMHV